MFTTGIALSYDQTRRRCDLAFDGRDLALDTSAITPVLISLGCDRRAHVDDPLPDVPDNDFAPSRLNARRGWVGDALDQNGQLIGSRWWLMKRRKQTEDTRLLQEDATSEALAWCPLPITIAVRWVSRGVLGTLVQVGDLSLELANPVAG